MAHWQRPSARLFTNVRQEELENLYVFGYQCKLFRDDERATYIDQGRHLIPWMGDPMVMIDRYDGRGHLHDLQPHDADHVSYAGEQTKEEEQRIEELCDEERYLELHTDLVQKAMYEEEELKRLSEAISDGYSAVGFNYNIPNPEQAQQEETQKEEDEEEEEPYYAPPELQLPADVIPPSTVKQNAIIEKTAVFVSKQGAQMEIMIKTKQQNNSQFDFMKLGSVLNPYYKHMIKMLKSGKYKPHSQQRQRQNSSEDYLHPSLVKTTESKPVIKEQTREEFINSVSSKLPSGQIENTLYAKLLNNLSKQTGRNSPKPLQTKASRKHGPPTSREYSSEVPSSVESAHSTDGYQNTSSQVYLNYEQPTAYEYDHYSSGPMQPPVPGMEPVHLPHHADETNGQPPPPGIAPHDPRHMDSTAQYSQPVTHQRLDPLHHPDPDAYFTHGAYPGPAESTLSSLVPQGPVVHGPQTHSVSIVDYPPDEPVQGPHIMPPPPDLLPVIDKMAVYVAKNGPEFEIIVRKKQDERFSFLNVGHPYNPYYEHKKQEHQREMAETQTHKEKKRQKQTSDIESGVDKSKHQNKAISFSLRAKEVENLPAALRTTALLYESSEEEDDEPGKEMNEAAPPVEWAQNFVREGATDSRSQPSDLQEKKQAEVRVKDRLALAARDKLAQASKENQIKAERKRKAAMFINMLKTAQPSDTVPDKPQPSGPAPDSAQASPRPSGTASPTPSASEASNQQPVVFVAAHSPQPHTLSSPARKFSTHSPSPDIITISAPSSPKRRRSRSPRRRSRSPLKWRRSRSRSPRRRKPRDLTPPSSYHVMRRSVSPPRRRRSRSRSKTPARYKRIRRSRSKEKKSKSKRSRSRSRTRGKSPSRSRKRSRSRSKTKSKKKSRSRSRTRKRSTSRSKSKKSKSKKSSRSRSRSPKHKRSHDSKKSDKKSHSKHSSHKSNDTESRRSKSSKSKEKKKRDSSPADIVEESPVVHHIEDSPSSSPVHHDGGVISDSSSSSSSPKRAPPSQQVLSSETSDSESSSLPPASKYDLSSIQEEFSKTHWKSTATDSPTSGKSPRKTAEPTKPNGQQKTSLPTATRTAPPPAPKPVVKPPPAPSIDMFAD